MKRESDWRITLEAANDEVYAILARDRIWNCFAIADLEPPFRAFAHFAVTERRDPPAWASCMVLRHPAMTVVVPGGDRDGIAEIFARLDLPDRALIHARAGQVPLVERHYRLFSGGSEMLRMAVTAETFRASTYQPEMLPERLTPDDAADLIALYAHYPTSTFRADELAHGVYYGIRSGDRIVAAAGTHALAPRYGIAVLGNVFTHPDERRQGYARAVTAALATDLVGRGCRDVALNVFADNDPAIRVYARLGFQIYVRYLNLEGEWITA